MYIHILPKNGSVADQYWIIFAKMLFYKTVRHLINVPPLRQTQHDH